MKGRRCASSPRRWAPSPESDRRIASSPPRFSSAMGQAESRAAFRNRKLNLLSASRVDLHQGNEEMLASPTSVCPGGPTRPWQRQGELSLARGGCRLHGASFSRHIQAGRWKQSSAASTAACPHPTGRSVCASRPRGTFPTKTGAGSRGRCFAESPPARRLRPGGHRT